jgi:hypothetical protein
VYSKVFREYAKEIFSLRAVTFNFLRTRVVSCSLTKGENVDGAKPKLPSLLFLKKKIITYIRSHKSLRYLVSPLKYLREEKLLNKIEQMFFDMPTTWQTYHASMPLRFERVCELMGRYPDISTVVDLASNQGALSILLARRLPNISRFFCVDYDNNAIDSLYFSLRQDPLLSDKIYPICFNCMCPSSDGAHERFKSDCALAFALTHHLLLSQNYSIDFVLYNLTKYTKKNFFVEFMPFGLSDGTQQSERVPDWYNITWFKAHLTKYVNIVYEEILERNRVLFIGTLISTQTSSELL